MKKFINVLGIAGVIVMIAFSLVDHFAIIVEKFYFSGMAVGFVMFVPMLTAGILSLKKKKD